MTFKVNVEISRNKQYDYFSSTVTLLAILLALPGFICLHRVTVMQID